MRSLIAFGTVAAVFAMASQAYAVAVAAPAPLLGAGIPSLAILAVTGAGYIALRMHRKNRD